MSEPADTDHVTLRLPKSVLPQLPAIVEACTGLPAPATKAATVTAALGALIVLARDAGMVKPRPRYTEAVTPRRAATG